MQIKIHFLMKRARSNSPVPGQIVKRPCTFNELDDDVICNIIQHSDRNGNRSNMALVCKQWFNWVKELIPVNPKDYLCTRYLCESGYLLNEIEINHITIHIFKKEFRVRELTIYRMETDEPYIPKCIPQILKLQGNAEVFLHNPLFKKWICECNIQLLTINLINRFDTFDLSDYTNLKNINIFLLRESVDVLLPKTIQTLKLSKCKLGCNILRKLDYSWTWPLIDDLWITQEPCISNNQLLLYPNLKTFRISSHGNLEEGNLSSHVLTSLPSDCDFHLYFSMIQTDRIMVWLTYLKSLCRTIFVYWHE